jgi:hypothetical protein
LREPDQSIPILREKREERREKREERREKREESCEKLIFFIIFKIQYCKRNNRYPPSVVLQKGDFPNTLLGRSYLA